MRYWPLLAGVLAGIAYLLTISRGAYPGPSASLVASAARLTAGGLPDHPFWSLVTRGIAQGPASGLPFRLNLFSAICGSAAVALFGLLISRFIFVASYEKAGGNEKPLPPEHDAHRADAHPATRVSSHIANHNRRAAVAALLGGWAGALALAFCVPFWSAATRLQYQTCDTLFLVITLHLVILYLTTLRRTVALAAAFLCGAGCVESEIFIPLSVVLFSLLPRLLVGRNRAWESTLLFALLSAAAGALLNMLAFLHVQASSLLPTPVDFWPLFIDLLRVHYGALHHSLPQTGWFWIVLLAFVPPAVVLLTARASFSKRPSLVQIALMLLFTVAALLCLFNASFSPWGVARESGHLTVMAYVMVAMVTGYLVAFWHLLGAPDDAEANRAISKKNDLVLSIRLRRWVGYSISWPLLVVVCALPLLNLPEADGRQGAFADAVAGDVVTHLGDRRWVASNGLLDNHLLLAAHAQGRPLHLLRMTAGAQPLRVRQLQDWIDSEPECATNRPALHQAARLGILPFLEEWLQDAATAERSLLVVGGSLIWKKSGRVPVPDGLGYTGTKRPADLRGRDLLGPSRAFWTRMQTALGPIPGAPPILDRLRLALRQQAGRCANDLGVLLQDLGRGEDAYEAYLTARRFDPDNLSALCNQSFLIKAGLHANEKDAITKALHDRIDNHRLHLPAVIEMYGDIRDPDALASEGSAWSLRGQSSIARAELGRSLALAPGSVNAECHLAVLDLTQGDLAGSEQAYRAMLAANPADKQAMIGLATVALTSGRTDDARQWLDKARAAGATADALDLCETSLLVQTGKLDEALAKLHAITDQHPSGIEAWSLLADVLFRQNALGEVEQRVLPSMAKAVGKDDHVLIHLVRAQLLSRKQPVNFEGARISYLRALALRPDLAGVRNSLLALDQQSGNADLMELDSSNVLRSDAADPYANYVLGAALLGRNELVGAEEHFRRSLTARRSLETLNDLAETLRRLRRFADAEKLAREALDQDPKFYQAWDTLACILVDAGRADDASKAIDKAMATCATDARLYVSLARVRIAQARLDDARRILRDIPTRFKLIPESVRADMATLDQKLSPNILTRP